MASCLGQCLMKYSHAWANLLQPISYLHAQGKSQEQFGCYAILPQESCIKAAKAALPP